jgi:hypothetical protein
MDKKGVSAVVATIILIFIAVILIGIVAVSLNGFLDKQKDSMKVISPQYKNLKISIDSVIVGPANMMIVVSRGDSEAEQIPLKGVRFKFTENSGNSYTHDENEAPIEPAESKNYTILGSDIGVLDFSGIKDVSVFGISPEGKQTEILDDYSLS